MALAAGGEGQSVGERRAESVCTSGAHSPRAQVFDFKYNHYMNLFRSENASSRNTAATEVLACVAVRSRSLGHSRPSRGAHPIE